MVNEGRAAGKWEVRSGKWEVGSEAAVGRAHSARPESCDAPSSPEPAAGGGDLKFEI